MRKKNPGNKAKLSKIPPKPSSLAANLLNHSPGSLHHDTPGDKPQKRTICHDTPSVTSSLGDSKPSLDPNSERNSESDKSYDNLGCPGSAKIEKFKERTCIICDKVGSLLVCNGHQCPLSFHQKCLRYSPSSDDAGNFYCPHCSYKRANAQSNRAYKKYSLAKQALLQFLKGMDGDKPQQKAEAAVTKEPSPSSSKRNENQDISKNKLEGDVNESEPDEHGQEENVIDDPGMNINNKINSEAYQNVEESLHLDDFMHDEISENQKESEPLGKVLAERKLKKIHRGCGREEETTVHAVESSKQADASSDISDTDTEILSWRQKRVAQGPEKTMNTRIFDFKEDSKSPSDGKTSTKENAGENNEKAKTLRKAKSLTIEDSEEMPEKADVDSDISDSDYELPITRQKRVAQGPEETKKTRIFNFKDNSKSPSDRKATTKKIAGEENQKAKTLWKSRQRQNVSNEYKSFTFTGGRRKKLLWTAEEEEMLKEGVQKFSTTAIKNLPWRKILDFGHHVFDKTRTPSDLKDKWRNILAKESSRKN